MTETITHPLPSGGELWITLENGWTVSLSATDKFLRISTWNRSERCVCTQTVPLAHKTTNPNPICDFR